MSYRLAVDIGGSHVTAALVDVERRCVVVDSLRRAAVREADPAEAILDAWAEVSLAAAAAAAGPPAEGVGLAVPAPFDTRQGISLMTHKFRALYRVPVVAELRLRWAGSPLKAVPISIANDADCFALGEWWAGQARGDDRVIGITLGTGLGAGFVRDGRIATDGPGVPPNGELWDMPYLDGRAEDYTAGRFITGSWRDVTGEATDAASVARLAGDGDPRAQDIFHDFGSHLGAVLRPHVDAFRPACVVIGGNLARAWPLFEAAMQARLGDVPGALSPDPECSTLLGAAAHR